MRQRGARRIARDGARREPERGGAAWLGLGFGFRYGFGLGVGLRGRVRVRIGLRVRVRVRVRARARARVRLRARVRRPEDLVESLRPALGVQPVLVLRVSLLGRYRGDVGEV